MRKLMRIGVFLGALAFMAAIWPVGIIRTRVESKSRNTRYMLSDTVKGDVAYRQYFIPKYDYLEDISIKIMKSKADTPENEGGGYFGMYPV